METNPGVLVVVYQCHLQRRAYLGAEAAAAASDPGNEVEGEVEVVHSRHRSQLVLIGAAAEVE